MLLHMKQLFQNFFSLSSSVTNHRMHTGSKQFFLTKPNICCKLCCIRCIKSKQTKSNSCSEMISSNFTALPFHSVKFNHSVYFTKLEIIVPEWDSLWNWQLNQIIETLFHAFCFHIKIIHSRKWKCFSAKCN